MALKNVGAVAGVEVPKANAAIATAGTCVVLVVAPRNGPHIVGVPG
jgi:hypothetical protein